MVVPAIEFAVVCSSSLIFQSFIDCLSFVHLLDGDRAFRIVVRMLCVTVVNRIGGKRRQKKNTEYAQITFAERKYQCNVVFLVSVRKFLFRFIDFYYVKAILGLCYLVSKVTNA